MNNLVAELWLTHILFVYSNLQIRDILNLSSQNADSVQWRFTPN